MGLGTVGFFASKASYYFQAPTILNKLKSCDQYLSPLFKETTLLKSGVYEPEFLKQQPQAINIVNSIFQSLPSTNSTKFPKSTAVTQRVYDDFSRQLEGLRSLLSEQKYCK